MGRADVREFVRRRHDAMRSVCASDDARREIDSFETGLIAQLDTRGHLRKLAGYPLLCPLLCTLHKDRRAALPNNRMELYEVALQMLLERRDAERRIAPVAGLERTEKILLLGDLAYWLIRNGNSDVEIPRAIDHLHQRLATMRQVKADASQVYRHLLERSGLLREPVDGRVDFIHRTFQEYLAADAAMNNDDVGVVVENAGDYQCHEVVVMAVGHASRSQREELLSRLLKRGDLDLLALACLETAAELSPELVTIRRPAVRGCRAQQAGCPVDPHQHRRRIRPRRFGSIYLPQLGYEVLGLLSTVRRLSLVLVSLGDLHELRWFSDLESLSIKYSTKLRSLAGIESWSHSLRELTLVGCAVADLDRVRDCPHLERLTVSASLLTQVDSIRRPGLEISTF